MSFCDFESLHGKQSDSTPLSSHITAEIKESSGNQTTREPAEELSTLVTPKVPVPVQTITNSPPSPEHSQALAVSTAYPEEAEAGVLPVQVFPTSPPAHLTEGQLLPGAALLTPAPQLLNPVPPLPTASTSQPEVSHLTHFLPLVLHFS